MTRGAYEKMTPVEPTAKTSHRMKPQRSIRLIRYTINQIALLFKIQIGAIIQFEIQNEDEAFLSPDGPP